MKRKRPDDSRQRGPVETEEERHEPPVLRWRPITRLAFRFCFVYFGLFILATQIAGSLFLTPFFSFRGLGTLWPMRDITFWIAAHVFGVVGPFVYTGNMEGEVVFFWVQTLWLLVVAVLATITWSALDRGRQECVSLHKWFRVFIRLGLASQMLEYGMTKIIPTQFRAPSLTTLVTPVGDLSLSTLLWTTIGAAPAYQIITGCAELLGGVFLLIPRTTTLGALICLADLINVFALNMTYDVPLKAMTFHLILLTLFLLAPDLRRLADFFFRDRPATASQQPQLFQTRGANRIALAAQVVYGIYLLGVFVYFNVGYWYALGGGSPRSPLFGIWNVEELAIDGQARPPILNDYDRRWRRVLFESPDKLVFQRTDDSFARYGVSIDAYSKTLALTKGNSRTWKASFSFERPTPDRLILVGQMDGFQIRVKLGLAEFDTLRLLNSDFRWVRPTEQ